MAGSLSQGQDPRGTRSLLCASVSRIAPKRRAESAHDVSGMSLSWCFWCLVCVLTMLGDGTRSVPYSHRDMPMSLTRISSQFVKKRLRSKACCLRQM